MKSVTFEGFNPGSTRKFGTMQRTTVQDHKASVDCVVVVRDDSPDTFVLFPMDAQDLGLENGSFVEIVVICDSIRML